MTSRNLTLLKLLLISLFVSVAGLSDALAATVKEGAYVLLKKQGESYVQKGSFAKAHEVYRKAQELDLSPPNKRWVDFRVLDTQWRSQAGTNNPDRSKLELARGKLQKMIRDRVRTEQQDRLCLDELRHWTMNLGWLLVSAVHVYAPEVIILSGGATNAARHFLEPLQAHVNRHVFRYPAGEPVPLLLSKLRNHAGVLGAAAVAWEKVDQGV